MLLKCVLIILVSAAPLLAQNAADMGHRIVSDLQAGKFDDARQLADAALRQSPNDARLWTLQALSLVELHRETDALRSFRRALRLAPDYLPALEGAAKIEFDAENPEAAALLNKIVAQRPADSAARAMLAALALRAGNCARVKTEYEQSQSPALALPQYGACLVSQKQFAEAVPVFEQWQAANPDDPKALSSYAAILSLTARYNEVISLISARHSPLEPDLLELLGHAYEASAKPTEASAAFRRAIIADPGEPRYYADLAYLSVAQRDFELGIEVASEGLRRKPDDAPLHVARGILYAELSDFANSESDFKTAEQLDSGLELVWAARGLSQLQMNDVAEAEKTVRGRIHLHPNDPFLYYLLAETIRRKGPAPNTAEFAEALNAAKKAVAIKPDFVLARDVLAGLYTENGNLAGAVEQSKLVLQNEPQDETALYHLILALRKSGETAEVPKYVTQLANLRQQKQMTAQLASERSQSAEQK